MAKLVQKHIVPPSRLPEGVDPADQNIVMWYGKFQRAWDKLFGNMMIEEVHEFIDAICVPGEVFSRTRLNELRGRPADGAEGEVVRHHIVPQSRLKEREEIDDIHENNIVMWYEGFHVDWHKLFFTMTLSEIHEFIDTITEANKFWSRKRLNNLRNRLMTKTEESW